MRKHVIKEAPSYCDPRSNPRNPGSERHGLPKSVRPLFRYPGGKYKLRGPIIEKLLRCWSTGGCSGYREPFFGGGAIACNLLRHLPEGTAIWINDLDADVIALWEAVMRHPKELSVAVERFRPSVEAYWGCRETLSDPQRPCESALDRAWRKLALHQTSYSGLGLMAGGPLGGHSQSSQYKVDSRWSPERLTANIADLTKLFGRFSVRCTSLDFETVLSEGPSALVYLDPPYFTQGPACYQHSFRTADHERLAALLRRTTHRWVLSYDDCHEIRGLYGWATIETVPVKYSIAGSVATSELLITREEV